MIYTQMNVVKNVFLATEGHLFYCEVLNRAGIDTLSEGVSYDVMCEIYSGEIIKCTGAGCFKIKRTGIDSEVSYVVLIPGQCLGSNSVTRIDISIDKAERL